MHCDSLNFYIVWIALPSKLFPCCVILRTCYLAISGFKASYKREIFACSPVIYCLLVQPGYLCLKKSIKLASKQIMFWLQGCRGLLKDIMSGWSEIQQFLMCSHVFIFLSLQLRKWCKKLLLIFYSPWIRGFPYLFYKSIFNRT